MSYNVKEMLDANVPKNFKHIQTGFEKIIRKLKKQFSLLGLTIMYNTLLPNWLNF